MSFWGIPITQYHILFPPCDSPPQERKLPDGEFSFRCFKQSNPSSDLQRLNWSDFATIFILITGMSTEFNMPFEGFLYVILQERENPGRMLYTLQCCVSGMFIPDLVFLPIPDPGVKKAPDPGSATLDTSYLSARTTPAILLLKKISKLKVYIYSRNNSSVHHELAYL